MPLTDSSPHPPANYDTFTPPAAIGGTYVDSVFGPTVKRLSKATDIIGGGATVNSGVQVEYASVRCLNANNTVAYLQIRLGGKRLYDANGGGLIQDPADYGPLALQMRWSRTDPNILYYVEPEAFYYTGADVAGPSYLKSYNIQTHAITTIHTFAAYANLYFTTQDLSPDGNYIAILANGRYVFWYRFSD